MKKLNFGSVINPDTGKMSELVLAYPKKDRFTDLLIGGLFIAMGIALPVAFRATYFKGAVDCDEMEAKALKDIGVMK